MSRLTTKFGLASAALAVALALGAANARAEISLDGATLLAEMQRALVPEVAQFSRVHIDARSDQPGRGRKDWEAMVIRQRDEQGARTAVSLSAPENLKGAGILTAPHAKREGLGLWLYTAGEHRPVEYNPLEADAQFLSTRFNFEDVGLTPRETQPPVYLGEERNEQGAMWKVETRPLFDRYYSRMLTWIAEDSYLPVKREYYDRAGKLWKVITYRSQRVDGIPTVLEINLHDVQSRDTAVWRVEALAYHHDPLPRRVLSPIGLPEVQAYGFWSEVVKIKQVAPATKP